jgi:hypothetical protein
LFSGPDRRRGGLNDSFERERQRGSRRLGNGVIVYPYVYFGYDYGYGYENGGYGGGVTRSSSHSGYVIEGHLDEASRQRNSRVYEVGPGRTDERNAVETEPVETGEPLAEPAQGGDFHLIALQGGLIYASREHWLLGNTLHFVTLQGGHYVVSLAEVDLDLSVQLNRERGLKFVLEVREQGAGQSPDPDPGR